MFAVAEDSVPFLTNLGHGFVCIVWFWLVSYNRCLTGMGCVNVGNMDWRAVFVMWFEQSHSVTEYLDSFPLHCPYHV